MYYIEEHMEDLRNRFNMVLQLKTKEEILKISKELDLIILDFLDENKDELTISKDIFVENEDIYTSN